MLNLITLIGVALVVGFGLSWLALTDGRVVGAFRIGAWTAWPDTGLPQPNPYARATLSRNGALQLGFAEGIQFTATTDDAGEPLNRQCRYRIGGPTPVAAFWTLVAVDGEGANIARPDGPLAVRSSDLARDAEGIATVSVSRTLAPFNWLEITGEEGPLQLVLTFYDASVFAAFGSTVEDLPAIHNDGCAA
jgi:hypothetical protein